MVKYIETGSRVVVARDWREGKKELLFNRHFQFSINSTDQLYDILPIVNSTVLGPQKFIKGRDLIFLCVCILTIKNNFYLQRMSVLISLQLLQLYFIQLPNLKKSPYNNVYIHITDITPK